jgi:predicted transglutaminase-like cysteine proteinase
MVKKLIFGLIILGLFVTNITIYIFCQNNINSLTAENKSLSYANNYLTTQYDECLSNYTNLQLNFTNLTNENIILQRNYSALELIYNEQTLPEVRFGRGGDATLFITPKNPEVIEQTKEILGNQSDGNLTIQDIRTIHTWIVDNSFYKPDNYENANYTEFYRYPNETLEKHYGDCEDFAILMVSMCKSEQNVPWLWCARVGFYQNNKYNGHVIVLAKTDDKNYYIFDITLNWKSNASDYIYDALERDYASYLRVHYVDVYFIFNENTYRRYDDISEFFFTF